MEFSCVTSVLTCHLVLHEKFVLYSSITPGPHPSLHYSIPPSFSRVLHVKLWTWKKKKSYLQCKDGLIATDDAWTLWFIKANFSVEHWMNKCRIITIIQERSLLHIKGLADECMLTFLFYIILTDTCCKSFVFVQFPKKANQSYMFIFFLFLSRGCRLDLKLLVSSICYTGF